MAASDDLIFHSDDAGATTRGTEKILEAWRSGLLESQSILANGDALELLARELAADAGRALRIAVHLNLSEGPPLSAPGAVPLLVGSDGSFHCTFGGLIKTWAGGSRSTRAALTAQI